MNHLIKLHRNAYIAIACGFGCLITNAAINWLVPGAQLPLGILFVMLCAGTLGPEGALVSVVIGIAPTAILKGELLYATQAIGLALTLGLATASFSKIPQFIITAAYWAIVATPLAYIARALSLPLPTPLWPSQWLQGFLHVFMALVAGTMLLNDNLWVLMVKRPKLFSLQSLLTHIVTILATTSMLVTVSVLGLPLFEKTVSTSEENMLSLALLTLCGILGPALIGWRLTSLVNTGTRELLSYGLLSHQKQHGFSGLSSPYWRRQNNFTTPVDANLTSSGNSDSSIAIPKPQNSQITPDLGICSLDNLGTITFTNRKFCKLAGINDRDIIGKKIDAVPMTQAVAQHLIQLIERTFKNGPQITELKINELPNNLRYFEIKSVRADTFEASSIADGPDNIIITVRDITDRRAIETNLLQAQKLTSLGNFISGMGHAFNNTLTTIVGHASFAQNLSDINRIKSCLSEILGSAKRAGELVKQLVEYAESKPGSLLKHDLSRLVDERIGLLKELVGDSFKLVLEKCADPVGIKCDSGLIMQALTNLVINAKDSYKEKTGEIRISIDTETIDETISRLHIGARPGQFARLRVKDLGAGMTPEIMAHAFDPLFTTKSSKGRAGLGLSSVFAIVRAHDGFLAVESKPSKGTTISVYLPICDLDREKVRTKSEALTLPVRASSNGKERILLVEDEKDVRELVATMLDSLGYAVTSCSEANEAIDHWSKDNFDLVLVDMVMPSMAGPELISELTKMKDSTKALIMTGYGPEYFGGEHNAKVISKPFDIDTLSKAVGKALHKSI